MSKSTIKSGNERDLLVRLAPSPQEPKSPVERLTVAMLRREIAVSFHVLVNRVADQLYHEEIADGAWLIDLGLFGSALFVPDVSKEIHAGDGKFWEISKTIHTAVK